MRKANSHPRSDKGVFKLTDDALLMKHSTIDTASTCRLWTGDTSNRWGYGRVSKNRIERLAHRLAYRTYIGEIPFGMKVLHSCDVPRCINPSHLFLGTDADNMRDMQRKGRTRGNAGQRGAKNIMAKLTDAKVAAIRSSGETVSELARKHAVSRRAIKFVLEGKTWSH